MSLSKWEYRIEHDAISLNELGEQGWELVAVTVVGGVEQLYLKRPAPSFRERLTLDQREEAARQAALSSASPGEVSR